MKQERTTEVGVTEFLEWIDAGPFDNQELLAELAGRVAKEISPFRGRHIYSVCRTADRLAERHAVDRSRTLLAGLGHDIAKERDDLSLEDFSRELGDQVDEAVLDVPALHHAALGVLVMVREYGVTDVEVLQAIRYHSTGHAELAAVGRVLFCADFVEPYREGQERRELEALCLEDLNLGCLNVLRSKLRFLLEKNRPVDPNSWRFWNQLVRETGKGKNAEAN